VARLGVPGGRAATSRALGGLRISGTDIPDSLGDLSGALAVKPTKPASEAMRRGAERGPEVILRGAGR
jgi:hypothetical protein